MPRNAVRVSATLVLAAFAFVLGSLSGSAQALESPATTATARTTGPAADSGTHKHVSIVDRRATRSALHRTFAGFDAAVMPDGISEARPPFAVTPASATGIVAVPVRTSTHSRAPPTA